MGVLNNGYQRKQKYPYTLFPKRNATLISRFFMVTLDQGQWPQVMSTQGNAPGSNREKTPSKNVKRFSSDYTRTVRNFEWGFWQIVIRSIVEMTFGPKFTDLHSSPKERQLQKSCVSFGEECILSRATSLGLQVTVAWEHGWRAPKCAETAHWLEPPTYWAIKNTSNRILSTVTWHNTWDLPPSGLPN